MSQQYKPPSHRSRLLNAFRLAVADQIRSFRVRSFDTKPSQSCPISGEILSFGVCKIDHEIPLVDLVLQFLQAEGLSEGMVPITDRFAPSVDITDQAIRAKWRFFHNTRAKLRAVSLRVPFSVLRNGVGRAI